MSLLPCLARAAISAIVPAVVVAVNADIKQVKLSAMGDPDAQIWEVVQKITRKDGPDVKIIELNNYVQPSLAFDSGDLDVNDLQHQPLLDSQVQARHYRIVNVGLTCVVPMGSYPKKAKSLVQLKEGVEVSIQNDPSNGNRALLLLQKVGVIKLKVGADTNDNNATPCGTVESPKKIKLIELDSIQLPRLLDDLDVVSINTDYAVKNGLMLTKDTIVPEDCQGSYANLTVMCEKDKDQPWVKTLVHAYQSEDTHKLIDMQFKGAILLVFQVPTLNQRSSS